MAELTAFETAVGVDLLCLFSLMVVNILWFESFVRSLSRRTEAVPAFDEPSVLVILCLRGSDPFLPETLQALVHQNYSRYKIRLIIDSPNDPAAKIVDDFRKSTPAAHLQICFLQHRRRSCSLKVSALLQELSHLDDAYDIIVQVDADSVPHEQWLSDMVAPFQNPRVGAVSAIRWYAPRQATFGTLLRYVWGVSAAVQMQQFRMVWGGSMAFRVELLTRGQLLRIWKTSLTDDLVMNRALKNAQLELRFVPVVLFNQESISPRNCLQFMHRQILIAKHYHEAWPWIASYTLINALCFSFHFVLGRIAWMNHEWLAAATTSSMTLLFIGLFALLIGRAESAVRRCAERQRQALPPFRLWYVPLIPFVLASHVVTVGAAYFTRQVSWRGVIYRFSGVGRIRILNDLPPVAVRSLKQQSIC